MGTAALLLIVATLIPLIESQRWWVRVFIFPQAQFAILLVLVGAAIPFAFSLKCTRTKLLLAAVFASLIYQLIYLLPYTPVWPDAAHGVDTCPRDSRLRILVLNVKEGNKQIGPVIDLVEEVRPDLFLAIEVDRYWAQELRPLEKTLPHVVRAPRDTPWGMTLYSRLTLISPEVRYLVDDYVPSIKAGVALRSGAVFNFYGLHPMPPLMHSSAKGEAEILRVGREIGKSSQPTILAGDLNDVPWGDTAQRFQKVAGMVDPRVGRGFDATYKANSLIMRWPLDHAYFTPNFQLLRFDPLRDVGSDHYPLFTELCLNAEPSMRVK